MNNYITYDYLTTKIKEFTGMTYGSDYLSREGFPYGITESEFNMIYDIIVKNNLRSGFEFATGIAVSTTAIGLAFKKTSGMLESIDSYVEASTQTCLASYERQNYTERSNRELESNNRILECFDIKDYVNLNTGWSPEDAIPIVSKMSPIDVIMLDGPKTTSDYTDTLKYLIPRLAEKYIIFVHDIHCFDFASPANAFLQAEIFRVGIFNFGNGKHIQRYPIGVITNAYNTCFHRGTSRQDEYIRD